MKRLAFVVALAAIIAAGCATSKRVMGPGGGAAYSVKCGAAVLDACYEEAAKVCPSGYDIADKQTLRGPNVLLVECKAQK